MSGFLFRKLETGKFYHREDRSNQANSLHQYGIDLLTRRGDQIDSIYYNDPERNIIEAIHQNISDGATIRIYVFSENVKNVTNQFNSSLFLIFENGQLRFTGKLSRNFILNGLNCGKEAAKGPPKGAEK